MKSIKPRYPKDEFAARGDAVYAKAVRPHLKPEDEGKFAAIDIESSEYEIADEEIEAVDRLRAHIPEAQIWMVRIGYRAVHRFGGRDRRDTP